MAYQSKPTSDGVYYIRVLNQNLCIESVPGRNPGMKLATPSASNNKQKVRYLSIIRCEFYLILEFVVSGTFARWRARVMSGR